MKKVSRNDIARLTDTSVSTVSRALNNSGYVQKEKKERILQTANELGYFPRNSSVMSESRSRRILYYCGNLRNSFFIHFYMGMLDTARANDYMILLNGDDSFETSLDDQADGIILPNDSTAHRYLEKAGGNYHLPVICASYRDDSQLKRSMPLVVVDMYSIVMDALDYLWSLGHRHIAFGIPAVHGKSGARNYAYRTWILEKGIHSPEQYFYSIPQSEADEDEFALGRLCAYEICDRQDPVTALLGYNDEFALGVLTALKERGVRVPEDMSVMGIDRVYRRDCISPLLTTMDTRPEEQGKACMELMIRMLNGEKVKHITRIPYMLETGGSTAEYHGGNL